MSINDPLCCGFIKSKIYQEKNSNLTLKEQFTNLKTFFPNLELSESAYKNRSKNLIATIVSLGKADKVKKAAFLEIFSEEKWNSLTEGTRKKHAKKDHCHGCLGDDRFRETLSYLPIREKDRLGKQKAEAAGLFRPVKHSIVEQAKKDISLLNTRYKKDFSVSFESALQMAEKTAVRNKRSQIAQEIKENIEDQWCETAVVR